MRARSSRPSRSAALLAAIVGWIAPEDAPAADVVFGARQVVSAAADIARSAAAADLDGDGDLDLLSASAADDTVAWYENTDGQGAWGTAQVISSASDGAASVVAADLDGDGDLDVLAASSDDDTLAWFENTNGLASFGPAQPISTTAVGAAAVVAADVDGDGDLDVLAASSGDDTVAWYENTDGLGSFGAAQALSTTALGAAAVAVADLDRDGHLDVVAASSGNDTVAWYENTDGQGSFGTAQPISTTALGAKAVYVADVDRDGDPDVLAASSDDDTLAWYANDAFGNFGPAQPIATAADGAASLVAADMDGDGDLDVVSASTNDDTLAWHENDDGAGGSWTGHGITSAADGAASVLVADLDGDGDPDVLGASANDDTVAWHENETIHSSGAFSRAGPFDAADVMLSVVPADVDGDGDLDVFEGHWFTAAWYENTDGLGRFGPRQDISTTVDGFAEVHPADVDGDGDVDLVTAEGWIGSLNTVSWFENTDGQGSFGPENVITAFEGETSAYPADLDGDGDLDVVVSAEYLDTVAWAENTDGQGTFGPHQVITTTAVRVQTVFAADLDSDEDLDVLSVSITDDEVAWYENTDGQGTFGPAQLVAMVDGARTVFPADLDGDGDVDVLASGLNTSQPVLWVENTDGLGTFGSPQVFSAGGSISLAAADVDGDGDLDAVVSRISETDTAWYENTDGLGTFGPARLILDMPGILSTGDVDGDGDDDVLQVGLGRIAWWENADGRGEFAFGRRISTSANGARSIVAGDMDRDGDADVVAAAQNDNEVEFYENEDGLGAFALEHVIAANVHQAQSVFVADVNGDSDLDVLSAAFQFPTIYLHPGFGTGGFGAKQAISSLADGVREVHAADLDGDGDVDVLSASENDDEIAWYENIDGLGSFGAQQVISSSADGAWSVFAADVDGDGDRDVLSASLNDDRIAWYENTDGLGSFGSQQTISTGANGARSVFAVDLDGDGDVDALSASASDDTIAWYENTDGLGTFGPDQIITTDADGALSVFAGDVDRDGDVDVLSASANDDTIAWYENTDGQGSFGPKQTISTFPDGAWSVHAADVDGDGDLDAISASTLNNTLAWFENRSGQVVILSEATAPAAAAPGSQVELLHFDVEHLGRAGDADLELDTLVLAFDAGPTTSLPAGPSRPLTGAEADALVDDLHLWRDDGSGAFEPGSDSLVASVSSLGLVGGNLTIDLPDTDPDAQASVGAPARFFVVADLSPTGDSADPNAFRVRIRGSQSQIVHAGTDFALTQAPGGGTQPRLTRLPEPALALQLAAGSALLAALARWRRRTG